MIGRVRSRDYLLNGKRQTAVFKVSVDFVYMGIFLFYLLLLVLLELEWMLGSQISHLLKLTKFEK